MKTIRNALTFDVEHWYDATLLSEHVVDPDDHIERSVDIVLDVLQSHSVQATFFVLGRVAEEYPELVREIADAGHELASHGHTHTPLFELTPAQFEFELVASADAIEAAAGVRPDGFRAPNFSVTPETDWAFSVLSSSDYRYDSSVFPRKTPIYGVKNAQIGPYIVSGDDLFDAGQQQDSETDLVESPLAVIDSTPRVPIAGGFYARVLPTTLLVRGMNQLNRTGIPANIYFHPWEFNPDVKTTEPPLLQRLVSFYGNDSLKQKLIVLLSEFEFGTVRSLLESEELLKTDQSGNPQNAHTNPNNVK